MPSSPLASPSILSAPPPPTEVKVRTMRLDLAAMAKSGGGLPRFENVKVAGLSVGKAADAVVEAKGKNSAIVILAAVAAFALLALLGYLIYKIFFGA